MTVANAGLPWAGYRFVQDVEPPDQAHRVHLDNLAIADLLYRGRNAYIVATGFSWERLFETDRNMVMRRLEIDFEREVLDQPAMKVGVRAIARSRRTMTFQETLWRVDTPGVVAAARSIHLVVRLSAPGAIPLPDDVVTLFESYDGHPLPGPTT